jgi:hypothetical protein
MTVKELQQLLTKQNPKAHIIFEAKGLDGEYISWEPKPKDFKFRLKLKDPPQKPHLNDF